MFRPFVLLRRLAALFIGRAPVMRADERPRRAASSSSHPVRTVR